MQKALIKREFNKHDALTQRTEEISRNERHSHKENLVHKIYVDYSVKF